jgi:drug/metabolite transporter (DMT)-like permease
MWILYSLLNGSLYAVTNIIEKYVIDKHVKDPNILVIFGGAIVFIIALILFFILHFPIIPVFPAFAIIVAGIFLSIYLIPYFQALSIEDASTVIPLYAFAPVMVLILSSLILKENLVLKQLIGFFIILSGALLISIKGEGKGLEWLKPRKVFFLMLFSSILSAFSSIIFKFVSYKINFWTTLTYEYFGIGIGTFLFLCYLQIFKKINWKFHGLNTNVSIIFIIDKLIEITAQAIGVFAITIAPVALVSVVSNTQPFFVFLFGIILSIWFPHIIKEDLRKKTVIIKIISMVIMFSGVICLTF